MVNTFHAKPKGKHYMIYFQWPAGNLLPRPLCRWAPERCLLKDDLVHSWQNSTLKFIRLSTKQNLTTRFLSFSTKDLRMTQNILWPVVMGLLTCCYLFSHTDTLCFAQADYPQFLRHHFVTLYFQISVLLPATYPINFYSSFITKTKWYMFVQFPSCWPTLPAPKHWKTVESSSLNKCQYLHIV